MRPNILKLFLVLGIPRIHVSRAKFCAQLRILEPPVFATDRSKSVILV